MVDWSTAKQADFQDKVLAATEDGVYVPPPGLPHLDFVVRHAGRTFLVQATVSGRHAYSPDDEAIYNVVLSPGKAQAKAKRKP